MATIIRPVALSEVDIVGNVPGPTPILEFGTGGGNILNATPVRSLLFPDNVLSSCFLTLFLPTYGGAAGFSVLIDWFAESAVTGNATWGARMLARTPADAQSVYTDVLSTAVVASTAASATLNAGIRTTVTVTATDSFASNDIAQFKIYRDGTASTDTMVGGARVVAITLSYSDT